MWTNARVTQATAVAENRLVTKCNEFSTNHLLPTKQQRSSAALESKYKIVANKLVRDQIKTSQAARIDLGIECGRSLGTVFYLLFVCLIVHLIITRGQLINGPG